MNTLGARPHPPAQPAQPPADEVGPAVDPAFDPDAAPTIALSVAGAAQGLGVAPGTLRSWERRYGLAPSLHTPGGHRRYGPVDLARLAVMHRLVQQGVPPAEAARVAIHTAISPEEVDAANPWAVLHADAEGPPAAAAVDPVPDDGAMAHAGASAGGGRVLPLPRSPRSARGLARAAMALDAHACHRTVSASLADRGTIPTWEELIRPVLLAVGDKWEQSNRGVEIEHSFSAVVLGALSAHAARLERPRNGRPVVLASAPDDLHDLPLAVLRAALADVGIRAHLVGARTPEDSLRETVDRLGPPVVFLWAQMPGARVPDLPGRRPATTLLVGGPGWATIPDGVAQPEDLAHAVGAVRTVMGL